MREIEVKILDIDVSNIRHKLKELGAKMQSSGDVEMVRFDYPDGRLKESSKMLRVRKINGRTELCFKGKKEDGPFRVREEIEVITTSFEDTLLILEKIGMEKIVTGQKHRESYTLGDVKIEIDTLPDIPAFLEVEAPTEERLIETIKTLGFTVEQTTNKSITEIKKLYENGKD